MFERVFVLISPVYPPAEKHKAQGCSCSFLRPWEKKFHAFLNFAVIFCTLNFLNIAFSGFAYRQNTNKDVFDLISSECHFLKRKCRFLGRNSHYWRTDQYFVQRKAVYIKKVAEILKEKYDSDIPRTVEDLCSLPGVGEKMAYLATHSAWGHMEGLGVDTHVHRIVNRLAWVNIQTTKSFHTYINLCLFVFQAGELNKKKKLCCISVFHMQL